MGKGGELYVFDMGKPVKINDLAINLIKLSGLIPGKDIQIVETGLRPGEKLYEELLADTETTKATHHKQIFIAATTTMSPGEVTELIRLVKTSQNWISCIREYRPVKT